MSPGSCWKWEGRENGVLESWSNGEVVGSRLLLLVRCLKNAGKNRKAFSVIPAQPESRFIAGEPKIKMDAGFRRHGDMRIL
jgi:hypothetical protein